MPPQTVARPTLRDALMDRMPELHRIAVYSAIGVIGFAVEAYTLSEAIRLGWATPITGRMISFPAAVLVTWGLNRRYTFRSKAKAAGEGTRYFISQCLGASANLAVYTIVVGLVPLFNSHPIAGLAVGAGAGLVVNYGLSAFWVFRKSTRHVDR